MQGLFIGVGQRIEKKRSTSSSKRPPLPGLKTREHNIGDKVSATTPEISTAPASANAKLREQCPDEVPP